MLMADALMHSVREKASNTPMPQCDVAEAPPPPLAMQFNHPDKAAAIDQLLTRYQRN